MIRKTALLAGCAALATVPLFADAFQIALVTRGLVWAMLALSVWFLLRILNLPSFGHAAFFGVAGYAAGIAVTRWGIENVFVALAVSVVLTCAVALPIALVAARLGNISFLLITLAFAEMLHSLALRWRWVGGSDGLVGVIRPDAWPVPIDLTQPVGYFYFTAFLLALCALAVTVVARSSFGAVLRGIRESEARMSALGYNTVGYRIAAFVFSAAIAGVAGAAAAYLNRFVNPEDLGALISARGLLIVVVAGTASWAAVLVAIVLTVAEDVLSSHTDRWLAIIGLVYVGVALFGGGPIRRSRRFRRPSNAVWQRRAVLRSQEES